MPHVQTLAPEPSGLLDFDGAADWLSTSPRHIRSLWQRHELAGVRVGGRVRFDPADLAAYAARNRVAAR